jgi:hypothetical protein
LFFLCYFFLESPFVYKIWKSVTKVH